MRNAGRLVLGVARLLGLSRLRETVLLPAIADMQHEVSEADSSRGRSAALARGYWSILSGATLYAAFLPLRHLRENWAGPSATGPQLLRRALKVAGLAAAIIVTLSVLNAPATAWDQGALVVALLIPVALLGGIPLALSLGVGWSLARDRSPRGPALGIGVLGALLMFAAFDLTVPRANAAFRSALVAPVQAPQKKSGEMTFLELRAAVAAAAESDHKGAMCTCAGPSSANALLIEWHKRLAGPAFSVSFVLLATVLSRFGRRAVVFVGLVVAMRTSSEVFMRAEAQARDGDLPVWLAVWSAQLVPLLFAVGLQIAAEWKSRGPISDGTHA